MKQFTLSNDVKMPGVGIGVWQAEQGETTCNAVKWAIEAGYRHIDAAMIYGNEVSVGQAIAQSNVAREDLFVTTKCWNEDIRQGNVRGAFEASLERLGLDYVDLYLIHWPATGYENAWLVFEELYKEGKVRAIGISNFHKHHYESLMKVASITPMVNQMEVHPKFSNNELVEFYKERNILVQAYSPLGSTGASIINHPEVQEIAKKHNKTGAQVVLKWNLQRDIVVLPKSVTKHRIEENINLFDFDLTNEDMDKINELNTDERVGANPDTFNF